MFEWLLNLSCNTYIVNDRMDTFVNLRKSPNGQIIRSVPNGLNATVLGRQRNWYLVTQQGNIGWMYSPLLRPDSEPYVLNPSDIGTFAYSYASQYTPAVQVLNGTKLELLDRDGSYLKVRLPNGDIRWILAKYVAQPTCYH